MCGVNSAAKVATTTGPVVTHGQTVVKSARNVTLWFIHITKDHWTSQILVRQLPIASTSRYYIVLDFQMKNMILAYLTEVTCVRSARD